MEDLGQERGKGRAKYLKIHVGVVRFTPNWENNHESEIMLILCLVSFSGKSGKISQPWLVFWQTCCTTELYRKTREDFHCAQVLAIIPVT